MTHHETYEPPPPLPVRSAVIGGLLVFAAVMLLLLLVRPAIFSLAPARGDGNLGIASSEELVGGPISRPVLLTESHGLLGERAQGGRTAITVIIATLPGNAVSVVNAWSPIDPCPVTIAPDGASLIDCGGRRWALDGTPLEGGALPSLQRFEARLDSGAVIADLTAPVSGPGAVP